MNTLEVLAKARREAEKRPESDRSKEFIGAIDTQKQQLKAKYLSPEKHMDTIMKGLRSRRNTEMTPTGDIA